MSTTAALGKSMLGAILVFVTLIAAALTSWSAVAHNGIR